MMPKDDGLDPQRKKLRKLLKGFRVAMLTTVTPEGVLRSRPMVTVKMQGDGDVWFLTKAATPKVSEVEEHQRVNVSYASPRDGRYVSLSGTARLVHDAQRVLELWRPRHKKWLPEGKRDPGLAAVQVHIDRAEYWDDKTAEMVAVSSPASAAGVPAENEPGAASRIADAMKALVTGTEPHAEDKPSTPGGAQG
jgi:general stress protein 26